MAKYRHALPQLDGTTLLTDSGLETTLVFRDGMELPCFASFVLLKDAAGRARLARYFEDHIAIAKANGTGFLFEAPTWRASADWGAKLGYGPAALEDFNRAAIGLMAELRARHQTASCPMVLSGNLGPRGDAYAPAALMSADEAEAYHAPQIATFADTEADMVGAFTMTYADEAIGIARAARDHAMPLAISFTVETDGRLPSGQALGDAIAAVDQASGAWPAYYMINCAHSSHFAGQLSIESPWIHRLRGVRANASRLSHAELDEAERLDDGDPVEMGQDYRRLRQAFPWLSVLGGCCGTDHRHVAQIGLACAAHKPADAA